jgi:Zn-dependent protease
VDRVQLFLLIAPVLLLSMVAHEYAHGYAALRQGDSTALQLGRLTWNPLKHVDPFLTVILPLMTFFAGGFIFGGAKPVPVVPRNFRNYKRGDIIVSLAGVAANAVLVVAFTLLMIPVGMIGQSVAELSGAAANAQQMLRWGILFNLILIFFNLLPIPPLDGSHVFKYLLPTGWRSAYQQIGRYGLLILVLLLTVGRDVLFIWMSPISSVLRFALRIVFPYMLPGVA